VNGSSCGQYSTTRSFSSISFGTTRSLAQEPPTLNRRHRDVARPASLSRGSLRASAPRVKTRNIRPTLRSTGVEYRYGHRLRELPATIASQPGGPGSVGTRSTPSDHPEVSTPDRPLTAETGPR
jgi:hypothetical protein